MELKRPEKTRISSECRKCGADVFLERYGNHQIDSFLSQLAEKLKEARRLRETKLRCEIRVGWLGAGRKGTVLGRAVFVEQDWTPVFWDDEFYMPNEYWCNEHKPEVERI